MGIIYKYVCYDVVHNVLFSKPVENSISQEFDIPKNKNKIVKAKITG